MILSSSRDSNKYEVKYNANIHIKPQDVKVDEKSLATHFRFCTVNLGNGVNEQKVKPFDERAPKHIADFLEMKPDIICMQEFRRFPENKIQPEDFMYQVEKALGHKVVSVFRNPSDLAFGQAISYNPRKFFLKQTVTRWLSDTPTELSDNFEDRFGSLVIALELCHVHEGKVLWLPSEKKLSSINGESTENSESGESKTMKEVCVTGAIPSFWVFCCHFPLPEAAKINCASKLKEIIYELCNSDNTNNYGGFVYKNYIVAGDFNTFYDADGKKQMRILLEDPALCEGPVIDLKDATANLVALDGKRHTGTFLGYDSDKFKQSPDRLSHLDHILVTPCISFAYGDKPNTSVIWARQEQLESRSTPSDHLAVVTDLFFDV